MIRIQEPMIDRRPWDQLTWDRDQNFTRPRSRPRPTTETETKKWSRDHIGLETLTSLEFNDTFNRFGTIPGRDRRKDGQVDILRRHNMHITSGWNSSTICF